MPDMLNAECLCWDNKRGSPEINEAVMDKKELVKVWEKFTGGNDFILNPSREKVEMLADGVLNNEKNHGLKYCPCRLRTGDFDKDLLLVCPCNFKIQKTWREKGECWGSLFVRR